MPPRAGVWRFNRQLVMQPETPLPDRCVRCNAPANGFRLKRQLYWHPPAYYLLIIVSLLIYLIVALCIWKKALIHIGLCEVHRRQRERFIAGSGVTVLVGLIMLTAAIAGYGPALGVAGVLFLGSAIFGAAKGAVVSAVKIDKTFVWVKGASQTFLSELPEWNGPK